MSVQYDSREMCKYGLDCYQKNPEHHRKFKHPKRKSEEPSENYTKKNKVDSSPDKILPEGRNPCSNQENTNGSKDSNNSVKNYLELPSDVSSRIEKVYLVKMPDDFYSFYDFCKSLNSKNPHKALADVDITLVGPFDLIDRNLKAFTLEEGLRHYRYYYDPPEFQTVFSCSNKQLLHYGYFRDDPKEQPSFVGSNEANSGCIIEIVGNNLFSALNYHLEKTIKIVDPFKKMKLQKIQQALSNWSTKNKYSLDTHIKVKRERKNKMVTKTFHGAGIVVPYDKKTELGYRELQASDKELKEILKNICESKTEEERKVFWNKLQPVITYANIANDECDFGATLELGTDLFCYGDPLFHKTVLNILPTSYELLGRNQFSIILKAHLENRAKGNNLNTIVK